MAHSLPAPTPTDSRDWDRIDAGHNAIDALGHIIGELRGTLEHDPDAIGELCSALPVALGHQPATPDTEDEAIETHPVLETAGFYSLRVELGTDGDVSIVQAFPARPDLDQVLTLSPDVAERLAAALHAAATTARTALTEDGPR